MDTPLFEQPESHLEEVALSDIQPWSTFGQLANHQRFGHQGAGRLTHQNTRER